VKAIDFAFVAGKWADPFWQFYDGLMLWLALIHGTNGMRTLVNDYTESEWLRKALNITLWVTAGLLILLGTLVITTFDPCIDPEVHTYLPDLVCKG
jgi:succinate dehydrogenase / fumarate reductase membrane anchor subunit